MTVAQEVANLRRRVDELDAALAQLTRKVDEGQSTSPLPWWKTLAGKYDDDPVFAEVVREGVKSRKSLKP